MMLDLVWVTRLEPVTKGQYDPFVPFIVSKVLASRFDDTPYGEGSTDIPEHVFHHRRAIKAGQSGS